MLQLQPSMLHLTLTGLLGNPVHVLKKYIIIHPNGNRNAIDIYYSEQHRNTFVRQETIPKHTTQNKFRVAFIVELS